MSDNGDVPDLPLFRYPHSSQTGAYKPPRRSARERPKTDRLLTQNKAPETKPVARGRLFGVRKRVMGGAVLFACLVWQLANPLPMLKEGVVKFGGEHVKNWLYDHLYGKSVTTEPKQVRKDIETGSISKEEFRKRLEYECNSHKNKDVETLIERRKAAYAAYTKCINEWVKPLFFSNQTAEQHCASKKGTFNRYARDVRDRQAKDCNASAPE